MISIIIPVYNAALYLHDSIKSLLNQTYKDFEIILVCDKACSDNSLEICNYYKKKDSRIQTFNPKCMGAANCRNYGFMKSRGEYVVFLDADDYFYPNLLLRAYECINKNELDVVIWGYEQVFLDENGVVISVEKHEVADQSCTYNYMDLDTVNKAKTVPWNKMVSRRLIEDNSICFQNIPSCNDILYSASVVGMASKVMFIEDILVSYFRRTNCGTSHFRENVMTYDLIADDAVFHYFKCRKPRLADDFFWQTLSKIYGILWKRDDYEMRCLIHNWNHCDYLKEQMLNKLNIVSLCIWKKILISMVLYVENFEYICTTNIENKSDMLEVMLKNIHDNGKKVALWGGGKRGAKVISYISDENQKFDYVIDECVNANKVIEETWFYDEIKDDVDVLAFTKLDVINNEYNRISDKAIILINDMF